MRAYEGVFSKMNAVVFYSNTGQSQKIAEYFGEKLHYPTISIEKACGHPYENLVLVFPVHCQNIPSVVADFLKRAEITYLTVIATYGKMCYGNILYEIQTKFRRNLVAGAYIPTKHTYLAEDTPFCDWARLTPVLEKIKNPSTIQIPKSYKNPLSNLSPALRSRLGVKIYKSANCDQCGVCTQHCDFHAIEAGVVNSKCIRCLRCVTVCPNQALRFQLRFPLKLYLRKRPINKTVVYI